jgi:hypothetical protein
MILGLILIIVYFIIAAICYNFLVKIIPDEVEYNNAGYPIGRPDYVGMSIFWPIGLVILILAVLINLPKIIK